MKKPKKYIKQSQTETNYSFQDNTFNYGTDSYMSENDHDTNLGGSIGRRLQYAENLEKYNSIDKVIEGSYIP